MLNANASVLANDGDSTLAGDTNMKSTVATVGMLLAVWCAPASAQVTVTVTRSAAQALIARHSAFTTSSVSLTWVEGGYEEYVAQGGANNPSFVNVVAT